MNPLEQLLLNNLQRATAPQPAPAPAPGLPPLPPGFQLEGPAPVAADPADPAGTGVGRAVERGALRTASTLPQLLATKDSTLAADMIDPAAILTDVLSQTSLGAVPPGLDLSSPDAAFAGLAQMGFPPQMVQAMRDTYEIRVRDAAAQGADVGAVLDRGVQNLTAAGELQRQANALPMSPRGAAFQEQFGNAPDDLLSALGVIAQDPAGAAVFLGETAAESVPQIGAAGAVGLATRSLPAMNAALGLGTMAQEYGPAVSEFMAEKGIVLRTSEDAVALLRDNGLMQEAAARGIGRAYVVALSEMAGQALAGAPFKSDVANAALGVGTQAATGAGGEVLARAATGQEQSAKEALVEGLAEVVTAPAELAPAAVQDIRARRAEAQPPAAAPDLPPLPEGFVLEQPTATEPARTGPWNPAPAPQAETLAPPEPQGETLAPQPDPVAEPEPLPVESQVTPTASQATPSQPPVEPPAQPEPASVDVEIPAPEPAPAPTAQVEPTPAAPRVIRRVKAKTPEETMSYGGTFLRGETPDGGSVIFTKVSPGSGGKWFVGGEYAMTIIGPDGKEISPAQSDITTHSLAGRTPFYKADEVVAAFQRGELDAQIEQIRAAAAKRQPAPAPAPAPAAPAPQGLDPNAVDELGNPLNPRMGGIVGGGEKTAAERRAQGQAGAQARGMAAAPPPAPAAPKVRAPKREQTRPLSRVPERDRGNYDFVAWKPSHFEALDLTDDQVRRIADAALQLAEESDPEAFAAIRANLEAQTAAVAAGLRQRASGGVVDLAAAREIARAEAAFGSVEADQENRALQLAMMADGLSYGNYQEQMFAALYEGADATRALIANAEDVEVLTDRELEPMFEDIGEWAVRENVIRQAMKSFRADAAPAAAANSASAPQLQDATSAPPVGSEEEEFDAPLPDEDPEAVDDAAVESGPWGDRVRTPRGGFTPDMRKVSFAQDGPVSEQAFRDAGIDPDAAVLMSPAQQRNILVRLLKDTFGIGVNVRGDLNLREGIDQLLDAYRGVRAMLAVLQLPTEALSLGGRLNLTFERFAGRYLGMYDGSNHTIHMPGRSNSFAHEWGHALDHFLRDSLPNAAQSKQYLLTQVARADGLNPQDSLQAAFINLVHRMFFDDAALALEMMDLEQKAQKVDAKGQPTKGAEEARRRLDVLRTGATRMRITPTAYRADSGAYAPAASGYYTSVHEMFARAFEAYIGAKLADAGVVTQNFVTKGDAAYLSDADRRLRMTFPKLAERVAIFKAFDDVFDHIRQRQLLGSGAVGGSNPDVDITDPAKWNKMRLRNTSGDPTLAAAKQELNGLRNALKNPVAALRATVSQTAINMGMSQKTPENLKALGRGALWFVNSFRGILKSHIARQPKAVRRHFQFLMGQVMTDPGTGSEFQAENYEEQVERSATRTASAIEVLLEQNGMKSETLVGVFGKEKKARLRQLLLDGEAGVPNATAAEKAVASGLRRLIDNAYRYGQKAGIDMGFVRDKGYLPRIVLSEAVEANPARFREQAEKVYRIYLDQITAKMDPNEVVKLANATAQKALSASNPLGSNPFAAPINALRRAVSDLNTAKRKLKAAQEAARQNPGNAKLQGDVQKAASAVATAERDVRAKKDALVDAIRDPYAEVSAEAWRQNIEIGNGLSFDSLGPAQDFKGKRVLPSEADDLLAEFYEDDPIDLTMSYVHGVTRQAAYATRLGQNSEEFNTVEKIVMRDAVRDRIADNPRKYNVRTAEGQLNIIRDLADPTRDNIKEMTLRSAEKFGADSEAIKQMRTTIEAITGRITRGAASPEVARVSSFVYMAGTIVALPRAMWTSITEPLTFLLKTGDVKNTGRVLFAYLREALRGMDSVRELQELSEMVGIVASPLHDVHMLNRIADGATMDGTSAMLSRFFRANFMAQLTNGQRRAVLYGATYALRDMARKWQGVDLTTPKGRADRRIVEADFRDLGVSDEQMEGFMQWLASGKDLPSLDDLATDEGKVFAAAVARFVDTTIMNPRRADKPPASLTPVGRLVYGLMSFIYAFTRNVHYATALRTRRNYAIRREEGMSGLEAATYGAVNDVAARLLAGFGLLVFGQVLVGAIRAVIFDSDRWEEKKEKDELGEWLLLLGVSRSGVMGGLDVIIQSLNGVRYERDLTSLTTGAYPAMFLGHVQNIIAGLPKTDLGVVTLFGARNTPNTETAENKAVKAAYQLFLAPFASAALSALPFNGPVGALGRNAALQYSTSQSASQSFADQFFTRGERQ